MPQVDKVSALCRELAEALIEVHPAYQQLTDLSSEQQEALTVRLARAIEQAANDEADSSVKEFLMTDPLAPASHAGSDDPPTSSWSVSVERNGENIVTIADRCLGGRDISAEDERVIRMAAEHLLSFVGQPVRQVAGEPPPSGWQPIKTAPKGSWLDGPERIDDPAYVAPPSIWLSLANGQRCVGAADAYYADGGGGFDGGSYWVEEFSGERVIPTHWMPLPSAPAASASRPSDQEKP